MCDAGHSPGHALAWCQKGAVQGHLHATITISMNPTSAHTSQCIQMLTPHPNPLLRPPSKAQVPSSVGPSDPPCTHIRVERARHRFLPIRDQHTRDCTETNTRETLQKDSLFCPQPFTRLDDDEMPPGCLDRKDTGEEPGVTQGTSET